MFRGRLGVAAVLVAISATGLAACGDDDDGEATTGPSEAQQAIEEVSSLGDKPDNSEIPKAGKPRGAYVGEYTAQLTEQEADRQGDPRLAGTSTLELRADGTYALENELDGPSRGTYGDAGDGRLVFAQDNLCAAGGLNGKGVYEVETDGDRLTMKSVVPETGGCTGRTQALTYPIWERR